MMDARVPGVYVFHRNEERGCLGAKYIVEHADEYPWLPHVQCCVSFDYPGKYEVVSHQMGVRCASDVFCRAFAARFDKPMHVTRKGIMTDSYVYREVVPNCINVSVGYEDAHTPHEWQDVPYAEWLVEQLVAQRA
jgi:di/tripeptidase